MPQVNEVNWFFILIKYTFLFLFSLILFVSFSCSYVTTGKDLKVKSYSFLS